MSDDELLKLENQICFVLYAASRALTRSYRPLLGKLGITYPQYLVFMVLWERDDITVKHLGEKLYLDSGTLTPLLKRMEKAGFLKRQRSVADERKVRIHLTKKGHELKDEALKVPETLANMICSNEEVVVLLGGIKNGLELLLKHLLDLDEKNYADGKE